MTTALKEVDEYERLAADCERACRLSRLTSERDFYTRQAEIFRQLAQAMKARNNKRRNELRRAS
jgi:hypothetical protein